MADQKITQLPQTIALDPVDQVEVCDNPGGSPLSQRSTIQGVHDAAGILTASGALVAADEFPVSVGGAAQRTTVQKFHNSTNILSASAAIALADKIAVYSGSAKQCTPDILHAAANALVASGALGLSDVYAVFNGGAATKGTLQKLLDAITVLTAASAGSFASGDKIPIYKTSAKAADYDDLENAIWNQSTTSTGWVKRGGMSRGSTFDTMGDNFPNYGGSVSASAADATQPSGANNASSSAINNFATNGSSAPGNRWTMTNNLRHTHYFKLVNNTDVRFYLGLFSTGVHRNSANSGNQQWTDGNIGTTASGIGIRFSTSAGDTNYQLVDSNAGTVAVTDTGVAPDTTNMQMLSLRLRNNGTQLDVYMANVKVIDGYTITCPTTAVLLVTGGLTNIAAVAKNWRYFGYYTAQKFY